MSATLTLVLCSWAMSAGPEPFWPQFRGPSGDGQVAEPAFPASWDEQNNIAWKISVPGSGWSQPVVAKGRVVVSSAISKDPIKPKSMEAGSADSRSIFGQTKPPETVFKWGTFCFDLQTGQEFWHESLFEQKSGIPTHPSNTFATETPTTDGQAFYTYFGSIGKLVRQELDGRKAWEVDLGVYPITAGLGTGSSPIVADGKVIVQSFNEENSFVVAIDAVSGKEVWRQTHKGGTSWSTPYVWKTTDRSELICCGKGRVFSFNVADGQPLWEMKGIISSFSASPVGSATMLFVGNSAPLTPAQLVGIKAGVSGNFDVPKPNKSSEQVLWSKVRSGPGLSSPTVVGDFLYIATDSFLNCYDAKSGERLYRERLPDGRTVVASPWAADGKLYVLDEEGRTFVVKVGPAFELLGVNKLDDTFWASSAIAGESLLLRGVERLYCVRSSTASP
jgi:outer membrane protein assembly factor BamB